MHTAYDELNVCTCARVHLQKSKFVSLFRAFPVFPFTFITKLSHSISLFCMTSVLLSIFRSMYTYLHCVIRRTYTLTCTQIETNTDWTIFIYMLRTKRFSIHPTITYTNTKQYLIRQADSHSLTHSVKNRTPD